MNEFTIIEIIIVAIIISIILVIVKWGMMRCKKADPISIDHHNLLTIKNTPLKKLHITNLSKLKTPPKSKFQTFLN